MDDMAMGSANLATAGNGGHVSDGFLSSHLRGISLEEVRHFRRLARMYGTWAKAIFACERKTGEGIRSGSNLSRSLLSNESRQLLCSGVLT